MALPPKGRIFWPIFFTWLALDIVTEPASHHRIAVPALLAGRHVLCEKPLSITMRGCRAILDAHAAAPPGTVLATEDAGPFKSIGRAWDLTRRNAWFTFGFTFVAGFLGAILGAILGVVPQALQPTIGVVAAGALGFVVGLLLVPWTAVTSVVLLDELRRRNDPGSTPA